jgi:tyrosyl-tRNA synthetase
MWKYYELLTDESLDEVKKQHPMEAKKKLAGLIIGRYHDGAAARAAKENFEQVFSNKQAPEELDEYAVSGTPDAVELLVAAGLATSRNEARRLVEQGGVQLDGQRVNLGEKIAVKQPVVLKVGKRKFKKLIPK